MAEDVDFKDITINYEGGSITMAVGNAKSLFGDDYDDVVGKAEDVSSEVREHPRTRVIGGAQTTVKKHNRSYKQWPTSNAQLAAGGKKIIMTWDGSDGSWTARVNGNIADLCNYLRTAAPKVVLFRTARGTKYGPFVKKVDDLLEP